MLSSSGAAGCTFFIHVLFRWDDDHNIQQTTPPRCAKTHSISPPATPRRPSALLQTKWAKAGRSTTTTAATTTINTITTTTQTILTHFQFKTNENERMNDEKQENNVMSFFYCFVHFFRILFWLFVCIRCLHIISCNCSCSCGIDATVAEREHWNAKKREFQRVGNWTIWRHVCVSETKSCLAVTTVLTTVTNGTNTVTVVVIVVVSSSSQSQSSSPSQWRCSEPNTVVVAANMNFNNLAT